MAGLRSARFAATALLALLLTLGGGASRDAEAQSGASMGGGDWSSSSSSHSSPSNSYSSSNPYSSRPNGSRSSSNYDGDSWNRGSSGGGSLSPWAIGLFVVIGLCYLIFRATKAADARAPMPLSMGLDTASAWGRHEADVTVLRFALDARVRKFVQNELLRIGKGADTATAEGRAQMLREVALLLRRSRDAWVYGGAINLPMTSLSEAKQQFDRHVADARGRFVHEVVRNAQGVLTTTDAPDVVGTSADGPGLVVVTIAIASRTELFSVRSIGTGDDLRQALESASNHSARDLIAIEIIWMPAETGEAISSVAVEAKYPPPDLVKLQGAMVGKVICQYCSGPFPAELVTCPHCGGRAAA